MILMFLAMMIKNNGYVSGLNKIIIVRERNNL
jgi:hypothetical protein